MEKRLIEKITRQFKKKYRVGDVFVGALIEYESRDRNENGKVIHYSVKDFASFFFIKEHQKVFELFSNVELKPLRWCDKKGELSYENLTPLTSFVDFLAEKGLNPNSKLTVEEMFELKSEIHKKINDCCETASVAN